MQSNQLEKLKRLIKLSSILNETERSEWLTLLELMDDKQAGELEKILMSTNPEAGSGKQEAGKGFLQTKPVANQWQKISEPAGTSFHHIMNFPKMDVGKPSPRPATISPAKPNTGFASKIKSILAEKELSGGRPKITEELELPAPSKHTNLSGPALAKPLNIGGKEAGAGALVQKKPAYPPAIPKPKPVSAPPVVANLPKTGKPLAALLQQKAPSSLPVKPQIADQLRGITRGSAGADNILPQQEHKPQDTVTLKEPKDAANLGFDYFIGQTGNGLVAQFKGLIKRYGYHEVVFNLEHSPLYKSYLDTGIKLLNDQGTFERMPAQSANKYFTREQFEKFTDFLRNIQAN